MIEQAHVYQRERLLESRSYYAVGGAGLRITARMVVAADNGCGVVCQRTLDDNTRVYFCSVERPMKQFFDAKQLVSCVQKRARERLFFAPAETELEQVARLPRISDGITVADAAS